MKGTYCRLKGQDDTITKLENVIGVENTELVYNWFFYDLPEYMWDYDPIQYNREDGTDDDIAEALAERLLYVGFEL